MTIRSAKTAELNLRPVDSSSVVDSIINSITDSILRGEIGLGDKLPNEYELVRQLGVSRNSLREAIKILAALGVVEIRRGDGTYIVSRIKTNAIDSAMFSLFFKANSNNEVIETRQFLDEAVIRAAIYKCTPEQIDHMQVLNDQLAECLYRGDHEMAAQLDFTFHKYIVGCLDNSFIDKIVLTIYAIFEKSIKDTIDAFSLESQAHVFHQKMIDCIRNRDTSGVHSVVEESLRIWRKTI